MGTWRLPTAHLDTQCSLPVPTLGKHSRPPQHSLDTPTPPGTPSSPLPAPTGLRGCRRPPPAHPTARPLQALAQPGDSEGNELAQQPGSCHGGKSPALSHQDLSLHPCCSSVLSSQTRKTPSLHPSALHALPVTLTCRSCCWNWRNWNSLCWEGRAAPFRGPEVQAALPCSHPCSRTAPGHLCQATQRDKVPP